MSKVCINMESDDPNCLGCLKNKSCFVPVEEKEETESESIDISFIDTALSEWSEDVAEYSVKRHAAYKAYDWIMNHAKPKIVRRYNGVVAYTVDLKIEAK